MICKHFPGSKAKKEYAYIFRHEEGGPIHGSQKIHPLLKIAEEYAKIPAPRGDGYIIEDSTGPLFRTENGEVRTIR